MLKENKPKIKVSDEVLEIIQTLEKAGFEAYPVGGCVRDILLGIEPKDWDITTNAIPQEIQNIFPDSVYENEFGTVGIKIKNSALGKEEKTEIVEVTTFRIEGRYTDTRHPDEIKFAKTLEEDLSRRDFTINAMALKIKSLKLKVEDEEIIDLFDGQKDLKNKIVRAVGDPQKRFSEDALRMLRAVRFASQLGFDIDSDTKEAIIRNSSSLKNISKERIRDEFEKIIMSKQASWGIQILHSFKLLEYIMPEFLEGVGVMQNRHHIYSVWEHSLRALDYCASKNYPFKIRMAALLHDVGKPRTKKGDGPDSTFYQHEYVSAKMTRKIMENLKFSKEMIEQVVHLVRTHMFYYNVGDVTATGVRRFLARVGPDNVDDILKVREADRIGSGVPKATPYKIRHLLFMIEKVKRDPISPKMLAIDGNDLMKILSLKPSPKVGNILNLLLEDVINDPKLNTREYLKEKASELNKLDDDQLNKLRKKAEERKEEYEVGVEKEIKGKFRI